MNSTPAHPTRGNLLLVDDTPNNLRLLSAMLTDQGYDVRRVVNGQMALKTAQANPPDLILLDIKMPDMNGYEVCQHLKAIEQTQSIPVIFISALDEVLDKVKAFAVGGVDYITKPFSEEEVFARVENILTIRKLQQQLEIQNQQLQQKNIERQQLEVNLANSEAKYKHLFHNPLVGLFQIRMSDGLFLAANQRLADLLGYDSAAAIVQQSRLIEHAVELTTQSLIGLADRPTQLDVNAANPDKAQFYRQDKTTFWALLSVWHSVEADCLEGILVAEPS
jgi:DNA-binding response OmpR family regulator